jgi:hypothetical protein
MENDQEEDIFSLSEEMQLTMKSAIFTFLESAGYERQYYHPLIYTKKLITYSPLYGEYVIQVTLHKFYIEIKTNTIARSKLLLYNSNRKPRSIEAITEKIILAEHKHLTILTQKRLNDKLNRIKREIKDVKELLSFIDLKERLSSITSSAISVVHLTEDVLIDITTRYRI